MRTKLTCCLVRRVKCDEAKPCCYACISTGRKCDGYGLNIEAPPHLSVAFVGALNQAPSIEFPGTEKESWSLYFFRQQTAPQLSGFFRSGFWETRLLQVAHHEPSVRHAVLALGFLHAKIQRDNNFIIENRTNGWTDDLPLKHYGQAVNILLQPLSQKGHQAIDVYLICSILFACIEVSRSYMTVRISLTLSRQCKATTAPLSHTSKAALRSCAKSNRIRGPASIIMILSAHLKTHTYL
jgi:hypothetical protein